MSRRRSGGYTLVELLVCVGVVAVLIGLLLPAVQKVRDRAMQTASANNLRQIDLAVHNYATMHDGWVPGVIDNPSPGFRWGSMYIVLMPYIEQEQVWRAYTAAPTALVKTYVSPADPTAWGTPRNNSPISYAANAQAFATRRPLTSVTDGLSHTIAFAEHYSECHRWQFDYVTSWVDLPYHHRGTFAEGGPRVTYSSANDVYPVTQGGVTRPDLPGLTFQVRPAVADCMSQIPQTPHAGGMLVAYLDGSVRVMAAGVAPESFWALVTPDGGEVTAD